MRRDAIGLVCSLLLVACGGGDGGPPPPATGGDGVGPADSAGEVVEDAGPLEEWPEGVTLLPLVASTTAGDLAGGALVETAWGGQPGVDCWIGTDPPQLRGHHVFYALSNALPKTEEAAVTVTPTAGVDVNLYALAFPVGAHYLPPAVPWTLDCPRAWEAGPGEAETLTLRNTIAPWEWLIVVSGPTGATTGAYELTLVVSSLR